ncbi:hypothetical protein EDD21DRAFT_387599 [Dissophora ornata]|nr:hypothetical protein EDD21DRAFT_387599 [Dissophora ornata]
MSDPVSILSITVASIKTAQAVYGLIPTIRSPVAGSRQSNDHVRNEVHYDRHRQRAYDYLIAVAQQKVSALRWIPRAIVWIAFTNCLRLAYETELFKDMFSLCVFLVSIFFKNLLFFLQMTVSLVLASFLSFIAAIHFLYPILSYFSLIIFFQDVTR